MRAFIAIDVPYSEKLRKLQSSIHGKFKAVEPENIHLTLKFLGEINDKDIYKMKEIVERCKPQPFVMNLRGLGFFPSENHIKIIWIGVEEPELVSGVMQCIDSRTAKLGIKKEKSYVPHITVARVKGKITINNVEKLKRESFGEVNVSKIKIKKSTLTDKGPIYEDIAVIAL